jgi:hypothetical protein
MVGQGNRARRVSGTFHTFSRRFPCTYLVLHGPGSTEVGDAISVESGSMRNSSPNDMSWAAPPCHRGRVTWRYQLRVIARWYTSEDVTICAPSGVMWSRHLEQLPIHDADIGVSKHSNIEVEFATLSAETIYTFDHINSVIYTSMLLFSSHAYIPRVSDRPRTILCLTTSWISNAVLDVITLTKLGFWLKPGCGLVLSTPSTLGTASSPAQDYTERTYFSGVEKT